MKTKDCKFQFSLYTHVVLFLFSFFSNYAGGPWKIPRGYYFLSRALDGLGRENRGSVNRLISIVNYFKQDQMIIVHKIPTVKIMFSYLI